MKTRSFRLGYRPELDGLRGIAVMLVMLVHAGIPFTAGGAIGVDIFFVLSGFLIIYLLCCEFDGTGSISLKNFYIRRLLRLSPALVLMLSAYGIHALLTKTGDELVHAGKVILIIFFYLADFAKAFGYSDLDKIAHTWSLAIEEHFYLLFPPLIYFLLKKGIRRVHISVGIFASACIVALYRIVTVLKEYENFNTTRVYFGFDYHIDGLLIGCALALLLAPDKSKNMEETFCLPKIKPIFAFIAGLFLTFCFLFISNGKPIYFELLFFINLSACVILLYLLQNGNWVMRSSILIWTGKISYGLYLWHALVYQIIIEEFQLQTFNLLVIGGSISFVVTSCCYYLVEKPILKLKRRFEPETKLTS